MSEVAEKGNILGYEDINKLIAKFAIPAIISMIVNAIYNIIDQVLIGWSNVGMLGIAATTVSFPMTIIVTAVSLLFSVGGASNFNLNLGEGKKDAAGSIAGNALSLGTVTGVVMMLLALIFLLPMLPLFGATEANMPLAVDYTIIVLFGIPFQILATITSALIRADGSPKYSMTCMLAGAIFNIVCDPFVLFVLGWGIKGIALTTMLGPVITTVMGAYYIYRRFKSVTLKKENFRLRFDNVKRIVALGLAAFFNQIAMTVMQIILNNALKTYGGASIYGSDITIAAVGSIGKINMIFLSICIGIGQGCQPINGFNYGAGNYDRVKRTYFVAIRWALFISAITFLLYQFFPRPLIMIFGDNPEAFYDFGTRYLRIYMMLAFLSGIQPVTSNFFTSIGKAYKGVFIAMTRQILFLIPLLVILPLYFALDGVLYAGPIAEVITAIVAIGLVAYEIKHLGQNKQSKQQIVYLDDL
jgi:putative MATE family efflux protein